MGSRIRVDYVVSLGGVCRVTYNLRRFFNFGTAFPFDWWVTDLQGVINAIESDKDPYAHLIENRQNREDILQIMSGDGTIGFHHEFPRDWSTPGSPVRSDWRLHIEAARARFMYLRQRLLNANTSSHRILFVRHLGNLRDSRSSAHETIDDLMDAIDNTFNKSQNIFLLINAPDPIRRSQYYTLRFHEREVGVGKWEGDFVQWESELSKLDFELFNPSLRPFEEAKANPEVERPAIR
jgi:hypothetical protein